MTKKIPKGPPGESISVVLSGGQARIVRIESEYRFAFELKNAARVMLKRAKAVKAKDYYERQAFVTGAIVLAYSYLNAGLNEFIFLNALADDSPLKADEKAIIRAMAEEDLRPQKDSQNVLELYNVILRLLNKQSFEAGKPPFQAANMVRILRNLLIHPEPGRVVTFLEDPKSALSDQQDIVRKLRSHLKLHRNATFPVDVLTVSCAQWAVSSCEAFFSEFVKRTGVNPGFITE
jgi:hypothetical protein